MLEEEKTRLEQSIKDLRPINPDVDIYSSNSIIKHISNKKVLKVKDGLLSSKEIEIVEFVNEKSLREILDTYNSNLLELKNTPLINKKIEDELETTKKKLKLAQNQANANLTLNTKLNTQVRTLQKNADELKDYKKLSKILDKLLLTSLDKANGNIYLELNEIVERIECLRDENSDLKQRIKNLQSLNSKSINKL